MEIVSANFLDLNALRKLEAVCFEKDAWPIFDLIAVLSMPEVVRLKAVEDGKMVGFVAGDPRLSEGWAWIATIGVDPAFQRRGIGRALLKKCEYKLMEKGLLKVKLVVRVSNHTAMALYQQEGYQTMDIWKGYYNDGEDGMIMEKNI